MALATLSIDLVAKIAQFEQDLGAAARASEKWAAANQAAADRTTTAFKAVAGAIGGLLTVDAIKQSFQSTVDMLDTLDDLSEKYGIAAETLSGYRFATEVAGTSTEAFVSGLSKLGKNATAAAGGNKELARVFDAIGVSVRTASGDLKNGDQLLLDVADKFAGYADGAGKAALAQQIFGKSGADMLPLLNKGREGISALITEGGKLGAVYGTDLAKAAGDLNDNFKKLELAGEAFRVKIFGGIIPALVELSNQYIKAKENGTVLATLWDRLKGNLGMDGGTFDAGAKVKFLGQDLKDAGDELDRFVAKQKTLKEGSIYYRNMQDNIDAAAAKVGRLTREVAAANEKYKSMLPAAVGPNDGNDALSRALGRPPTQKAAPIVGGASEKDTAAEKALQRAAKLYDDLNGRIAERASAIDAELYSQEKLTDGQKLALDVVTKLAGNEVKLSDAQKQRVTTALEAMLADEQALAVRKELREAADADVKAEQSRIDALTDETFARTQSNLGLADEIRFLNLTAAQIEAVKIKREEARLEVERGYIEVEKALGKGGEEIAGLKASADQLERNIALRKQYADATTLDRTDATRGAELGVRDYLRSIEEAGESTRSTVSSSMRSLEDSLGSSLETGKLDVKSFIRTLLAEFQKLAVVRPLLKGLFGGTESGGLGGGGFLSGLLGVAAKGISGMFGGGSGISGDGSLVDFAIPESASANGGGLSSIISTIGSFITGKSSGGGATALGTTYAPTYNLGSDIGRSEVYSLLAQQGEQMRAQALQDMQGMRNA